MAESVSRAREETKELAADAAERGKEVTATVQEQAGAVVQEARDQARRVASEARTQVRVVADDAKDQLRQQARRRQAGSPTASSASNIRARRSSPAIREAAGQLAEYADRALASVGDLTQQLRSRGVDDLLGDLRRFAQRRPGAFLAGAVVMGFVAGRMLRSVRDEQQETSEFSSYELGAGSPSFRDATADAGVLSEASYG